MIDIREHGGIFGGGKYRKGQEIDALELDYTSQFNPPPIYEVTHINGINYDVVATEQSEKYIYYIHGATSSDMSLWRINKELNKAEMFANMFSVANASANYPYIVSSRNKLYFADMQNNYIRMVTLNYETGATSNLQSSWSISAKPSKVCYYEKNGIVYAVCLSTSSKGRLIIKNLGDNKEVVLFSELDTTSYGYALTLSIDAEEEKVYVGTNRQMLLVYSFDGNFISSHSMPDGVQGSLSLPKYITTDIIPARVTGQKSAILLLSRSTREVLDYKLAPIQVVFGNLKISGEDEGTILVTDSYYCISGIFIKPNIPTIKIMQYVEYNDTGAQARNPKSYVADSNNDMNFYSISGAVRLHDVTPVKLILN